MYETYFNAYTYMYTYSHIIIFIYSLRRHYVAITMLHYITRRKRSLMHDIINDAMADLIGMS